MLKYKSIIFGALFSFCILVDHISFLRLWAQVYKLSGDDKVEYDQSLDRMLHALFATYSCRKEEIWFPGRAPQLD